MPDSTSDPALMVVNTLPSLNPPLFFEIVEDQVYRSNKCDVSSFPFLVTLRLNTVVYLSYDDLSHDLAAFFTQKDIDVVPCLLLDRMFLFFDNIITALFSIFCLFVSCE